MNGDALIDVGDKVAKLVVSHELRGANMSKLRGCIPPFGFRQGVGLMCSNISLLKSFAALARAVFV